MVYNPLDQRVERELKLPLYYTGLSKTVRISEQGDRVKKYKLDRRYNVTVPVGVAPRDVTWILVE